MLLQESQNGVINGAWEWGDLFDRWKGPSSWREAKSLKLDKIYAHLPPPTRGPLWAAGSSLCQDSPVSPGSGMVFCHQHAISQPICCCIWHVTLSWDEANLSADGTFLGHSIWCKFHGKGSNPVEHPPFFPLPHPLSNTPSSLTVYFLLEINSCRRSHINVIFSYHYQGKIILCFLRLEILMNGLLNNWTWGLGNENQISSGPFFTEMYCPAPKVWGSRQGNFSESSYKGTFPVMLRWPSDKCLALIGCAEFRKLILPLTAPQFIQLKAVAWLVCKNHRHKLGLPDTFLDFSSAKKSHFFKSLNVPSDFCKTYLLSEIRPCNQCETNCL